jgi:hypothetical protein
LSTLLGVPRINPDVRLRSHPLNLIEVILAKES